MQDYQKMFTDHMHKLSALIAQRDAISIELENVRQMVTACYNMLSEEDQKEFFDAFSTVSKWIEIREKGLTDAIRKILQSNPKAWFSADQVRKRLQEAGFDFSGYISNPLSSIHTVLKRLKPTEVKTRDGIDGKQYQWIMRSPRMSKRLRAAPNPFEGMPLLRQVRDK